MNEAGNTQSKKTPPPRKTLYKQFLERLLGPLAFVLSLAIIGTIITGYQVEETKQVVWRTRTMGTLIETLKKPLWDCDDKAAQSIVDNAKYFDVKHLNLESYCTKSKIHAGDLESTHDSNHFNGEIIYHDDNGRDLPVGKIDICFYPDEIIKQTLNSLWRYLLIISAMALALYLGSLYAFRELISRPLAAFGNIIVKRRTTHGNEQFLTLLPLTRRNDELTDVVKAYDALMDTVASQRIALERQVRLDPLTGLGNRVQLEEVLRTALAEVGKQKALRGFVLLIDLNKFKPINDTLGHAAGDIVLQATAQRLLCAVSAEDTVIRLGGDEFVIVVKARNPAVDIEALLKRIAYLLAAPLDYHGTPISISASVGVACFPDEGTCSNDLLKRADLAMYAQKTASRAD